MLFGYKIFCGIFAGVLVDTSWENAEARVREYYRNDKRYLEYTKKQKELFEDIGNKKIFGEINIDNPIIEIYDLGERFHDNVDGIYELTT